MERRNYYCPTCGMEFQGKCKEDTNCPVCGGMMMTERTIGPKIKVELGLTNCANCEKMNIAMQLYQAFQWQTQNRLMSFDRETQSIALDGDALMRLIQMVNPMQQRRDIRIK